MYKIVLFFLVIYPATFLNNVFADSSQTIVPAINQANGLVDLGMSENCSAEPVFGGKACVYEINKNAKQTVVFVHGLNARAESWISQIAALKNKYHVVSFDLPGFGKSSRANKTLLTN